MRVARISFSHPNGKGDNSFVFLFLVKTYFRWSKMEVGIYDDRLKRRFEKTDRRHLAADGGSFIRENEIKD